MYIYIYILCGGGAPPMEMAMKQAHDARRHIIEARRTTVKHHHQSCDVQRYGGNGSKHSLSCCLDTKIALPRGEPLNNIMFFLDRAVSCVQMCADNLCTILFKL